MRIHFRGLLQSNVTVGISPGDVLWAFMTLCLRGLACFSSSVSTSPTYPVWQFMTKVNPKIRSSKVRWPRILSNFPTPEMHHLLLPLPKLGLQEEVLLPSHHICGSLLHAIPIKTLFSSISMIPLYLDIFFCQSLELRNVPRALSSYLPFPRAT